MNYTLRVTPKAKATLHEVIETSSGKVIDTRTSKNRSYGAAIIVRYNARVQVTTAQESLDYDVAQRSQYTKALATQAGDTIRFPGYANPFSRATVQGWVDNYNTGIPDRLNKVNNAQAKLDSGYEYPAFVLAYAGKPRRLTGREAGYYDLVCVATPSI